MTPRASSLRTALAGAAAIALSSSVAAHAQPPRPGRAAAGPVKLLQPRFVPPGGGARARAATASKRLPGAPRELSARLARLATPALRAASPAARARQLGLPAHGAGSLVVRAGDQVVVRIRAAAVGARTLEALRAAGAHVQDVDARLRFVTAAVAPADLPAVARVEGVLGVTPALAPLTSGAGTSGAPACHGAVTSEADQQLHAADARQTFGVSGAGVKVGIISDSFDSNAGAATHAAGDVLSGDLPGPGNPCGLTTAVDVRADASGEDEGRAMAQVVHDLAPGAALAFAPATPESAWPDRIDDLASAGADVIVDDISFADEPFFQEGPLAVAADRASAAGIPYYSSAANNNLIVNGTDRASWEAPSYRPTACPTLPDAELSCMNFAAAGTPPQNAQPFAIAPGGTLTLDFQWAEPWFGVGSDFDIFLLDGTGNPIPGALSDDDNVHTTQTPFEFLSITNTSSSPQIAQLVIGKFAGGNPRLKWSMLQPEGNVLGVPVVAAGDTVGPAIFGHNGGAGVMSVAAVPFNSSAQVESFSSRGPVTHYFGPVTSAVPAAALTTPDVLAKPDLAATDGAATTFFAENLGGIWRFFGTSEAAPHAAAVAALELEAAPNATVAQIEGAEKRTAVAVGGFGAAAAGSGLVNALGAVGAVRQPPSVVTGPAQAVTTAGASLTGAVNPNGLATTYHFDYGLTTAYGAASGVVNLGPRIATAVPALGLAGGLSPGTTYHYRLVATNAAGTTFGRDATFRTAAAPGGPTGGTPGGSTGGSPGGSPGGGRVNVTAVALGGRRLTLRISGPVSKVAVTIRRGGKVVARVQGRVRGGKVAFRLARALKRGRYRLTIVLTRRQGSRKTLTRTLKV